MRLLICSLLSVLMLLAAACGGNTTVDGANASAEGGGGYTTAVEVRVFAAASLTDAVNELKRDLERRGELKVKTSFGASSDLARQILEGAPCDIFISADQAWMDKVKEKDGIEGASKIMARNRLVCIARADSPLKAAKPEDLQDESFGKLAIADENVPAGKYARAALTYYKVIEKLKPRFVGQKDVRAVLKAVSMGELGAGFVYSTDAKIDRGVKVLFQFDAASHPRIVYPIAVCKGGRDKAAAGRFVAYVLGKEGRALLEEYGFEPGDAP